MTIERSWKKEVIHLVGEIISFWGFKENHGKIWALLYTQNKSLSTSEIRKQLKLSKGATSMLLNDLETWEVVKRIYNKEKERRYAANTDFFEMIVTVIKLRESGIVQQSIEKLKVIEKKALQEQASETDIARLHNLNEFALLMKQLLLIGSSIKRDSIQQVSSDIQKISEVLQ